MEELVAEYSRAISKLFQKERDEYIEVNILQIRKQIHVQLNLDFFSYRSIWPQIDKQDHLLLNTPIQPLIAQIRAEEDWCQIDECLNRQNNSFTDNISNLLIGISEIVLATFTSSFFFSGTKEGLLAGATLVLGQSWTGLKLIRGSTAFETITRKLGLPYQKIANLKLFVSLFICSISLTTTILAPVYTSNWLNDQARRQIQKTSFGKAERYLNISLAIYPENNDEANHLKGFIEDYLHNPTIAKEYYRKSIGYLPSINNLARILLEEGKIKEAVPLFLQVVVKSHKSGDTDLKSYALKNLGIAFFKEGRLVESAISFEDSIELNPTQYEAYCYLGQIRDRQNQPELANSFWEKCFKLSEGKIDGHEMHYRAKQRLTQIDKKNK